ncbi:MAG: flagellar basal body-associated FliL family protein [Rhodospirillaceae bacterium]|jgi:flagellar protein FliL|nr:flagellar basal body-associated FliL family protein [Rhodospirillaceae bacterium]MBT5245289.1 flagellar basal body-associated FliL family protein [Rhodospirillaceae bacterium]MBT5563043.1 flagellar basal body-associated FliL family protein [Rhodospirillaceae bacterium]MBT6241055.1 flagellar basal body-associated FliL family protein [Rhodospirillaceae bacterium]MBT7138482.1 flagellar basal body-associated FliL family protein [Rhodospirillaceae bacterium]
MSDEEEELEEDEDGEEEDEEEGSGGGKKKLFLIIGVVVLLLGGGGAGAYFMGLFGGEEEVPEVVVIPPGPPVYHEFPQLVVDLKKKGARTNYIKLKVVVEIVTRDLPLLVAQELKIVDKMQGYLRSQTRDEVAGGAGTENMRAGITKIVTEIMGEVKVEGVLFREILLQ